MRFAVIARIDQENQGKPRIERVSIRAACAALGVSPSGYYAWKTREPSAREAADRRLTERLAALHERHKRRYGLRRLDQLLRREGAHHSIRRLRRLARAAGIESVHPKARAKTTVPAAGEGLVDLIDRAFVPESPGQVLYSDITYIPTQTEGFVYLVTFADACSRRIVGWEVADHMRTEMVTTALDTAIATCAPKLGNSSSTPTAARNTPRTPSATSVSPPASSPRSDALDPVSTMPRPRHSTPQSKRN